MQIGAQRMRRVADRCRDHASDVLAGHRSVVLVRDFGRAEEIVHPRDAALGKDLAAESAAVSEGQSGDAIRATAGRVADHGPVHVRAFGDPGAVKAKLLGEEPDRTRETPDRRRETRSVAKIRG